MSSSYTSVDPLLALLHDDNDDFEIQEQVLELINQHVHEFWSQLASEVPFITKLGKQTPSLSKTCNLIVSKLEYHLGNIDTALNPALQSEFLIETLKSTEMVHDSTSPSVILDEQFQQVMIARAIEVYIEYQRASSLFNTYRKEQDALLETGEEDDFAVTLKSGRSSIPQCPKQIDARISALLELLIDKSIREGDYNCALGLAADSLRLDWVKKILITVDTKTAAMLMKEAFSIAINIVDINEFRQDLLRLLVDLYQLAPATTSSISEDTTIKTEKDDEDLPLRPSTETKLSVVSDILALCQCLLALNDTTTAADILTQLIESPNPTDHLLAYQVAYDLTQNQQVAFTSTVATLVLGSSPQSSTPSTTPSNTTAKITPPTLTQTNTLLNRGGASFGGAGGFGGLGSIGGGAASKKAAAATSSLPTVEPSNLELSTPSFGDSVSGQQDVRTNLHRILTGVAPVMLHSHFLYKNAQSQDDWYKTLSAHPDFTSDQAVASQLYTGYSIAQAGTHRDQLIRNTWATFDGLNEWAQFTAHASIGNIYRGQYDAIKTILQPFLPNPTLMNTNTPVGELGHFNQGGALFAIGLAASGVNNQHIPYLTEVLTKSMAMKDEPVQAGAALSIGLCGVGTNDMELFEKLREILWGEQPIAGQAAGIAIGLLFIGASKDIEVQALIKELLATACNNPHQNIQFGQGLGLALMHFNAQQSSESIQAYLRYGPNASQYTRWLSCWIDAMAYCGTGSIHVVERLLDYAITDPDNDVKRTSILALAFVLLNEPMRCIEVLEPLSSSYNEHVRYAVAMAIGIVTSSSGLNTDVYTATVRYGLSVITPLLKDRNDVVRQGALIGYAMMLQQTTSTPRYHEAIKHVEDCFQGKRQRGQPPNRVSVVQRIGGALAGGILHAGGMNSNVRLIAPIGNQKRTIAIAGMMLFVNHWNWFPLANMFALTLSPTAVIGTHFATGTGTGTQAAPSIRVPPALKFVVKNSKAAMAYPRRESDDEIKSTIKKAVVNSLSTSTKRKKDKDGNVSNTSLGREPSLKAAPSISRNFASDLLRTHSSIQKDTPSTPKDENKKDDKMDDKDAAATKDDKKPKELTTSQKNILANFSAVNLLRGAPIDANAPATMVDNELQRTPSSTSLDKTLSQVLKREQQKENKLPVSVLPNCSRVLPRHIPQVTCPKGQQYQPLKARLFGIVVVQKMFDDVVEEEQNGGENATTQDGVKKDGNNDSNQSTDKKEDELAQPPTITPGGDISSSEPGVPGPFSMTDE